MNYNIMSFLNQSQVAEATDLSLDSWRRESVFPICIRLDRGLVRTREGSSRSCDCKNGARVLHCEGV